MTGLLSAISGQFAKSLLLGTVLPVIIVAWLGMVFLLPLLPSNWPLLSPLQALDDTWKAVLFTLVVIVASTLLSMLSIPILRLYEGYPWKGSWPGRKRIVHYQDEFRHVKARRDGLRTLSRAIQDDPQFTAADKARVQNLMTAFARQMNTAFPSQAHLVLPTRLGNVIRNAETYPNAQYGFDGIIIWPRLVAKIDSDYAGIIDDAKTSFDFMLNSAFLLALLAATLLVIGLIFPIPPPLLVLGRISLPVAWLAEIGAFTALSWLFYEWSIGRAGAWGSMLKASFDLYRWDLLKQLGHKQTPIQKVQERDLWRRIGRQMEFGDAVAGPDPDYDVRTAVTSTPDNVGLRTTRGIAAKTPGQLTIRLAILNADSKNREATDVSVLDSMPDGFEFLWGSAQLGRALIGPLPPVAVVGTRGRYQFIVGNIAVGETVNLQYTAISLANA